MIRRVAALCMVAVTLFVVTPALAETTLTVDLSTKIRPATHVGNGSLYGVTEKLPADAMTLVAPLHPNMFTNPAANVQQPQGDAIVVAQRVQPFGATVTIRLADWFPGWYSFTNMDDWFDKMSRTVASKKSAQLTNVYAYEIWNEPNGTWKNDKPLAFNEFWRQSFVKLRALDPNEKITGPSLAGYNASFIKDFLTFCKAQDCLPDIVGWHDGEGTEANVKSYRQIEKQLGVGPLPITINEYSGSGRIDDEGRPGASAPLIAQLERSGVETACITYWDVPHPGRLGSLLASDTQTNGGWFFYKWYGEMTGDMVTTSSSLAVNGKNLDGVASVDASARTVFVVLGGVNDGTIRVLVKGFGGAPFLGAKVHVVVERTPFVDRSTAVMTTDVLQTSDAMLAGDQLELSIEHANGNDGYRVSLTALDGGTGIAGMGGAVAAGGGGGSKARTASGAGGSSTASSTGAAGKSATNSPMMAAVAGRSATSQPSAANVGGSSGGVAVAANESTNAASSGCSCRVVRATSTPTPRASWLLISLMLALRGLRRRSSRRRTCMRDWVRAALAVYIAVMSLACGGDSAAASRSTSSGSGGKAGNGAVQNPSGTIGPSGANDSGGDGLVPIVKAPTNTASANGGAGALTAMRLPFLMIDQTGTDNPAGASAADVQTLIAGGGHVTVSV